MSSRALLRLVLGLACVALPGAAAAQAAVADPLAPELLGITFEGVTHFSEDSLALAIFNRETECRIPPPLSVVCLTGVARDRHYLAPAELRADSIRLVLYYYERGFRSAQVEERLEEEKNGVRLRFRVQEGPPVRVRKLEIAGLPEGMRKPKLPLREGDPFDLVTYGFAKDSLEAVLREQGYAHAIALPSAFVPRGADYADVLYEVEPGVRARFGPVRVIGAEKVDSSTVRRMLSFEEGERYRESEVRLSQRNLFAVDYFRHARVAPDSEAVAPDSVVPVVVQVNEGDPHRIRLGAGVNTEECVNAEGRWAARNFFGGARRLEITARVANVLAGRVQDFPCSYTGTGIYAALTGSVSAAFTQPAFVRPGHTLGAGIFLERQSLPGVFVRNARGAYVSLTRAPGARSSFTIAFRPELTDLDAERDAIFCTSFTACEAADIRVLRDAHWLSPISLSFARDRSNALFAPTRGFILRIDGEMAARFTGSDFAYTRLIGELDWYHSIIDGLVLAARLRPGWARATDEPGSGALGLHPSKRFFAGGPNSIRGFAQARLGPKVLEVDPMTLLAADSLGGAACTIESVNDGSCDANLVDGDLFEIRPVGGSVSLESSLELRFPLGWERLRGAVFTDVGQVWRNSDRLRLDDLAVAPGVGIRYFSPAGPIRVDLGYDSQGAEILPVLTSGLAEGPDGVTATGRLHALRNPISWRANRGFTERLQLHFSIGQAF